MTRLPKVLIAAALTSVAAAPAAQAAAFRDTVYKPPAARASGFEGFTWTAPDGHTIRFRLSPSLGLTAATAARAESYGQLLESKLHAFEMSRLTVQIVRNGEMDDVCGPGALACYGQDEMVVPYSDIDDAGVTVAEVITHEYGHHLAAYRRNSLGRAINWGPQSWASSQAVCRRADEGLLHPGDEWEHYWTNPGEGFAEAYARLHFQNVSRWDYSRLLKPDQRAFSEIAFDAANRLSRQPSRTTFRGSLNRSRRSQTFTLDLTQDSALNLSLKGPRSANFDLRLMTPGYYNEETRSYGARDRLRTSACFEKDARKRVQIRVTRRWGSGRFALNADQFDRYEPLG